MGFVLLGEGGSGPGTIPVSQVKPSFYFQSEVFGHPDPANTELNIFERQIVVDIGGPRGGVFAEDVTITFDLYSPTAVRGLDYEFPGRPTGPITVTIPAFQQQVRFPVRALPFGLAGTQQHFVLEMVSTTHGEIGSWTPSRYNRWTGVLLGAADIEGLIPALTTPSDDYQVYADRIEDLVHGITIPLPLNVTAAEIQQHYGSASPSGSSTTLLHSMSGGSGDELLNGAAIAANLAQKVWLDRNGGSFGTVSLRDGSAITSRTQIQNNGGKIAPAVKWLDEGTPVVVRVMETSSASVLPQIVFGGQKDWNNKRPDHISWGDHIVIGTTPAGMTSSGAPASSATSGSLGSSASALPAWGSATRSGTSGTTSSTTSTWWTATSRVTRTCATAWARRASGRIRPSTDPTACFAWTAFGTGPLSCCRRRRATSSSRSG